jgi:hypothetical protein
LHRHRHRLSLSLCLSLSVSLCPQTSSTPVKAVSLTAAHMPVLMYASSQRHRDFECWRPRGRQSPSSWTCSVGAHGERGAVWGRSLKRARRSHAARETDNAAAARLQLPWQRFSSSQENFHAISHTFSFFSFPFLFLAWLLGR